MYFCLMDLQSRKIAFLEAFLQIKDLSVIDKLTETLRKETNKNSTLSLESFSGILNDRDAKIFEEGIEESRKIDEDEW